MSRKVTKSISDIIINAARKKEAQNIRTALKKASKEQAIAAKKAAKEEEKKIKLQEKIKEKELILAIRAHEKEKLQNRAEKQLERKNRKYEIQTKTLTNLIPAARDASTKYPNGFTAKQFTNLYIQRYGNINPYTLEPVDNKYDIYAAIRGIMYETSPSSEQHWFRYGIQKVREQVAPWVFVNKELAIINDAFEWKVTTKDMVKARRQNKGLWNYMTTGSHAFYDWSTEKYGPLPTEEILKAAAVNRKVGVRGRSKHVETD